MNCPITQQLSITVHSDIQADTENLMNEVAESIFIKSGEADFTGGTITVEEAIEHACKEHECDFYEYVSLTAMKQKGARGKLVRLLVKSAREINENNLEMAERH